MSEKEKMFETFREMLRETCGTYVTAIIDVGAGCSLALCERSNMFVLVHEEFDAPVIGLAFPTSRGLEFGRFKLFITPRTVPAVVASRDVEKVLNVLKRVSHIAGADPQLLEKLYDRAIGEVPKTCLGVLYYMHGTYTAPSHVKLLDGDTIREAFTFLCNVAFSLVEASRRGLAIPHSTYISFGKLKKCNIEHVDIVSRLVPTTRLEITGLETAVRYVATTAVEDLLMIPLPRLEVSDMSRLDYDTLLSECEKALRGVELRSVWGHIYMCRRLLDRYRQQLSTLQEASSIVTTCRQVLNITPTRIVATSSIDVEGIPIETHIVEKNSTVRTVEKRVEDNIDKNVLNILRQSGEVHIVDKGTMNIVLTEVGAVVKLARKNVTTLSMTVVPYLQHVDIDDIDIIHRSHSYISEIYSTARKIGRELEDTTSIEVEIALPGEKVKITIRQV